MQKEDDPFLVGPGIFSGENSLLNVQGVIHAGQSVNPRPFQKAGCNMPTLCLSKWEVAKLATVSWGRGECGKREDLRRSQNGILMNMEMVVILHGFASLRFASDDMTKQKLR